MKRFVFLPGIIFYSLLFITIYAFLKFPFWYKFFTLSFILLITYVFRRKDVPHCDTIKSDGEIYLSPTYGTVESIRNSVAISGESNLCHEVRISISIWDQKGLYLPTAGEVSYLKANKGIKISRSSNDQLFYRPIEELEHTDLTLTSKNKNKTLLRFIDCERGKRPNIWLKSGDRGRGAACFGYYPFGGTMMIYLPINSDILVFKNERVVPGQTVIASIKDFK